MNTFGLHTQVGYSIDTNLPEETAKALIQCWMDWDEAIDGITPAGAMERFGKGQQDEMYPVLDTYPPHPDDYLKLRIVHADWNFC